MRARMVFGASVHSRKECRRIWRGEGRRVVDACVVRGLSETWAVAAVGQSRQRQERGTSSVAAVAVLAGERRNKRPQSHDVSGRDRVTESGLAHLERLTASTRNALSRPVVLDVLLSLLHLFFTVYIAAYTVRQSHSPAIHRAATRPFHLFPREAPSANHTTSAL
jgi:hypothetical protein